MKNILIAFGVFAIVAMILASGSPSGQSYYRYFPAAGTLSAADADTLVFIDQSGRTRFFGELYSYNITAEVTQVGDTATSLIAILEESNEFAGTNWYEIERDTGATGTTIRLHGGSQTGLAYIKGHKARIIFQQIGVDTLSYNFDAMLKQ
jgi:hypothetical protein